MQLITNAEKLTVKPELIQLAQITGLTVSDNIHAADLLTVIQESWLKKGQLRADIVGRIPIPTEISLLRELGCVSKIHISRKIVLAQYLDDLARRLNEELMLIRNS